MYTDKKVVVVLPAYNAAPTLEKTYRQIPMDVVDEIVLGDDNSSDETIPVAKQLGIKNIIQHKKNKGYGANQKSCYEAALELGGDIIIMLHPDYQYPPKLIPAMTSIIGEDLYPVVLGSRMLGSGALEGGMPIYKYFANRSLTALQNLFLGENLSEYHTGYRAFSRKVLKKVNYETNADDFIFDNQILAQIIHHGYDIAEVTSPVRYFENASSVDFKRSIVYGFGVLNVTIQYVLHNFKIKRCDLYENDE